MDVRALFLILGASVFISSQAQELASSDNGTYRVRVNLVMVDAQVISKKTHEPVSSLQQNDLEIYEDGVRQNIIAFHQDELPLSVVLLFDLTDSVRPVLQSLAEGARRALEHLKPEDEVAVIAYAATTRVIQDFTTDRELAAQAIAKASRMESREAAFFNEAVFQAAAHLAQSDASRRRVIIWLTDDVPNIPSDEVRWRYGRSLGKATLHTEKQALEELFRTGTVVCTLLKRSEISDNEAARRDTDTLLGRMMYPPGKVSKYAEITGGQVVESSAGKLPARLAQLIDDIRLRYTLGYRPSATRPHGSFCAIKVKLAPEAKKAYRDAVVEAKQGYYR